ncbi:RL28 protein, partial [Crocuta crocuta]
LQWKVLRKCSHFPMKRNKQAYSTEPHNLKARHSHYNRLIHRKTGGVEPPADDKGIVVVEWRSGQRKPTTSYMQTTGQECENAGATPNSIRRKRGSDLPLAAILRAGAILAATAWDGDEEAGLPHPELLSTRPPTSKTTEMANTTKKSPEWDPPGLTLTFFIYN